MSWLGYVVTALVAGLFGWTLRSMRRGTERRVLDEIYTRKVKLAEEERDRAIVQLNEMKVEVTTFQERFDGYESEVARLQDELRSVETALGTTETERKKREQELAHAREEIATGLAERERARRTLEEASAERGRFEESISETRATLERRDAEVADLSQRLASRDETIGGLRTDSEQAAASVEEVRAERDGTREELERTRALLATRSSEVGDLDERLVEQAAEVERLRAELGAREDELREQASEREERLRREMAEREEELRAEINARAEELAARATQLTERSATIEHLRARLAELEPLPAELASVREQWAAAERSWGEEREGLDSRWDERHRTALETKGVEVAGHERRVSDLQRLVATLEKQGDVDRTVIDRREAEVERLEAKLAELAPLPPELDRERRRASGLEGERDGLGAELEQVRARAAELAPLPKALAAERKKSARLEDQLGRRGERLDTAEARIGDLRRESEGRAKELAAAQKQIGALSSSHKTVQLKVDKLMARAIELAEAVDLRDKEIRDLKGQVRESAGRVKAARAELEAELARKTRDELQEINGIGPAMERKLQELGVCTYRQIAVLDREDVDKLAEGLAISPARIRKERWVAGAARQYKAKYGEKV